MQGESDGVVLQLPGSAELVNGTSTGSECMTTSNIEQTIDRIFAARRLTRRDQQMLMSMFSRRNLTPNDAALISRVYEALSQGRLRVVD
jgi:hypothetical protein